MADDLAVALERLRTSTVRLNTLCDSAAQTIRDTEQLLEQLGVGVSSSILVSKSQDEGDLQYAYGTFLSYERYQFGKFRIVVTSVTFCEGEVEENKSKPWSECTRDEKLETFPKLPELLAALADEVDEKFNEAAEAVQGTTTRLPLPKKRKGGEE